VGQIQDLAEEVPPDGEEFAESVVEKSAAILATVETQRSATAAQLDALANMRDGLQRWVR
jgi:hypothetical protein